MRSPSPACRRPMARVRSGSSRRSPTLTGTRCVSGRPTNKHPATCGVAVRESNGYILFSLGFSSAALLEGLRARTNSCPPTGLVSPRRDSSCSKYLSHQPIDDRGIVIRSMCRPKPLPSGIHLAHRPPRLWTRAHGDITKYPKQNKRSKEPAEDVHHHQQREKDTAHDTHAECKNKERHHSDNAGESDKETPRASDFVTYCDEAHCHRGG